MNATKYSSIMGRHPLQAFLSITAGWRRSQTVTTYTAHLRRRLEGCYPYGRGLLQGREATHPRARHLPCFQLTHRDSPTANHKTPPK